MSETLLEIKGLNKIYDDGVQALKGVDLKVKEGEFLGIIGLSGSGKSTLLRCINRLIDPSSGEIHFEGKSVTDLKGEALRNYRSQIGMIFQHFNLVNRKSVLTNVLTGKLGKTSTWNSLLGNFSKADIEKAKEFLELVGLQEKVNNRADELSGGQKQRVAIARSLMQNPKILLADEPVASLDPATSHSVMDHLRDANQKHGKTIICNLHFLSLVREYTTRVVALKEGNVVYEGSPNDISEDWFRRIYGEQAREVKIH